MSEIRNRYPDFFKTPIELPLPKGYFSSAETDYVYRRFLGRDTAADRDTLLKALIKAGWDETSAPERIGVIEGDIELLKQGKKLSVPERTTVDFHMVPPKSGVIIRRGSGEFKKSENSEPRRALLESLLRAYSLKYHLFESQPGPENSFRTEEYAAYVLKNDACLVLVSDTPQNSTFIFYPLDNAEAGWRRYAKMNKDELAQAPLAIDIDWRGGPEIWAMRVAGILKDIIEQRDSGEKGLAGERIVSHNQLAVLAGISRKKSQELIDIIVASDEKLPAEQRRVPVGSWRSKDTKGGVSVTFYDKKVFLPLLKELLTGHVERGHETWLSFFQFAGLTGLSRNYLKTLMPALEQRFPHLVKQDTTTSQKHIHLHTDLKPIIEAEVKERARWLTNVELCKQIARETGINHNTLHRYVVAALNTIGAKEENSQAAEENVWLSDLPEASSATEGSATPATFSIADNFKNINHFWCMSPRLQELARNKIKDELARLPKSKTIPDK